MFSEAEIAKLLPNKQILDMIRNTQTWDLERIFIQKLPRDLIAIIKSFAAHKMGSQYEEMVQIL